MHFWATNLKLIQHTLSNCSYQPQIESTLFQIWSNIQWNWTTYFLHSWILPFAVGHSCSPVLTIPFLQDVSYIPSCT